MCLKAPLISTTSSNLHIAFGYNQSATDDVSDCLRSFTDTEELEDTERYMCGHCKKRQRSTKKFWIRRLPKVLCLHLKRFRWSSFLRTKIETYVEFPINDLDMSGYQLNVVSERGAL